MASGEQARLLVNVEYSDDDIWTVVATDTARLELIREGSAERVSRPLSFFETGTFFIPDNDIGRRIQHFVLGSMSLLDQRIQEAKSVASANGFSTTALGSDIATLKVAKALTAFASAREIPTDADWTELHELFTRSGNTDLMRTASRHVAKWVQESERLLGSGFDVFRRVSLAYLYRHTGQLRMADEICSVLERPRTELRCGDASIAVLSTIRAATLMDLAENAVEQRPELLRRARLALNRANGLSGGSSQEVMACYQRLARLDKNSS